MMLMPPVKVKMMLWMPRLQLLKSTTDPQASLVHHLHS